MPRKATGTLVWHKTGWHARYWATVDGERKRLFQDLETKNELIAKRKLQQLVKAAQQDAGLQQVELFEQAAQRIIDGRARTVRNARAEASYMRKHVHPILGKMPVDEIGPRDITSVLECARDAGLAAQTLVHIRNACVAVFKQLKREGVINDVPVRPTDELPESLPETIDDRPKAVLSDQELMIYLGYTDQRSGERFRGAVRERQMMALLSRCVGGMRTNELHGLTWARAQAENGEFDALEVVRYKTRRKATRRGSKVPVRQLYPLGDTVLPVFLRFWWARVAQLRGKADAQFVEPDLEELLFPIRRARRREANNKGAQSDRVGQRRESASWAKALRRDLLRAFEAAHRDGVVGVPRRDSRRWAELFEGTDDRRPLWFHNSRNAAAIVAERIERLNAAARFTGHASGRMLQHYREMAGEVDVVPVLPGLLPEPDVLLRIARGWCAADGVSWDFVRGSHGVTARSLQQSDHNPLAAVGRVH